MNLEAWQSGGSPAWFLLFRCLLYFCAVLKIVISGTGMANDVLGTPVTHEHFTLAASLAKLSLVKVINMI